MNGGRWIAAFWVSVLMLILTSGVLSFSFMGDCPKGEICERPVWLTAAIFGACLFIWIAAITRIARGKRRR